ncbi:MAG: chitobiase/beta-hexosaminidase C-terminal domain-containing protein, partial [Bacteroidales bacterium]|nr:chitobiase/beta-hexosaminidase C-terminal domain-containing protein [Bacteroidales bacterium]
MRELYLNVSQHFLAGKLAEGLRRHSQKLRAVVAVMAMMVMSCGLWAQIQVGDTLWYETWTGGTADELPSNYSFTGTTIYGDVELVYASTDNGTTITKLYNAVLAGGTTPELLIAKSAGTWTISNIPTGGATEMALSFLSNKTTFSVTSETEGIEITGSQKAWTITAEPTVTNFEIVIANTGSANARIDNIVLTVVTVAADENVVLTPTFSPVAGTYNGTQNITIACATDGATIRYTLDGTDPTETSTEYTAAIEVSANTTIKAKAWKNGLTASEIATAEYVITNYTPLDAPTFSPVAGTYTGAQNITISASDGATILYTLDGTDPTETSTEYTAAIAISSSKTIKAKVWMDGYLPSDVATADYVIELPTVTFNKLASHTQITTSDVYMIVDV